MVRWFFIFRCEERFTFKRQTDGQTYWDEVALTAFDGLWCLFGNRLYSVFFVFLVEISNRLTARSGQKNQCNIYTSLYPTHIPIPLHWTTTFFSNLSYLTQEDLEKRRRKKPGQNHPPNLADTIRFLRNNQKLVIDGMCRINFYCLKIHSEHIHGWSHNSIGFDCIITGILASYFTSASTLPRHLNILWFLV